MYDPLDHSICVYFRSYGQWWLLEPGVLRWSNAPMPKVFLHMSFYSHNSFPYQRVTNVSFSENFANVPNDWSPNVTLGTLDRLEKVSYGSNLKIDNWEERHGPETLRRIYQGVRNFSFSENLAKVVNKWSFLDWNRK